MSDEEENRGHPHREKGRVHRSFSLRPRSADFDGEWELSKWIQCDRCEQWRRINPCIKYDPSRLPDKWECRLFPLYGKCKVRRQIDLMKDGESVVRRRQLNQSSRQQRESKRNDHQMYADFDPLVQSVYAFRGKLNKAEKDADVVERIQLKGKLCDLQRDYAVIVELLEGVVESFSDFQTSSEPQRQNIEKESTEDDSTSRYLKFMPEIMHPHVLRIVDVPRDGSCGFHVVAQALSLQGEQLSANLVRQRMIQKLSELSDIASKYTLMMDGWKDGTIAHMVGRLKPITDKEAATFVDGVAPRERWLSVPEDGFLIADTFECIVHHFSPDMNYTYVPTLVHVPPGNVKEICILHVNRDHFVRVELKDGSPLPPIPVTLDFWKKVRTARSKKWYGMIQNRLNLWRDGNGGVEDGYSDSGSSDGAELMYHKGLVVFFKLIKTGADKETSAIDIVTPEDIRSAFCKFGPIEHVDYCLGAETGYIRFENAEAVDKACATGALVKKRIVVKINYTATLKRVTGDAEREYWSRQM